jgi:outer membrane protein assembly factor BamA
MDYVLRLAASIIILIIALSESDAFGQAHYIRSVKIISENVFPLIDQSPEFVYNGANRLHTITKPKVIQRELLFKSGDSLDMELLDETERNLRKSDLYEAVSIEVDSIGKDSVDIHVKTIDQWSFIPALVIESGGGLLGIGASLEEFNFLGLGKGLYLEVYNESDVGTSWTAGYYDPQVAGKRLTGYAYITGGPIEQSLSVGIDRPFFSSDTKWSYGIHYEYKDEFIRLFQDGNEVSRIDYNKSGLYLDGEYAFGERYRKKKVRLKYRYVEKKYFPVENETNTPLPNDELVSATYVEFSTERKSFTKDTQIDNFKFTEDFTLGYKTSISVGRAGFPFPVGVNRFEYDISHRHRFRFTPNQLLFLNAGYESQVTQNRIIDMSARYYWQSSSWHTLALNAETDLGADLQPHIQFLLGGESGLRGYRAREFSGDKLILLNLESRIFFPIEILTVAIGTVVFMDAGNVWKRNETVNLSQLNYSAGFGFRGGMTKTPGSTVVRIDFGWPIGAGGGFGISFGVDQQFIAH